MMASFALDVLKIYGLLPEMFANKGSGRKDLQAPKLTEYPKIARQWDTSEVRAAIPGV